MEKVMRRMVRERARKKCRRMNSWTCMASGYAMDPRRERRVSDSTDSIVS